MIIDIILHFLIKWNLLINYIEKYKNSIKIFPILEFLPKLMLIIFYFGLIKMLNKLRFALNFKLSKFSFIPLSTSLFKIRKNCFSLENKLQNEIPEEKNQNISETTDGIELEFEFQKRPKYEAALSQYIDGNYKRSQELMKELKEDYISEKKENTIEFVELLKKSISLNKTSKNLSINIDLIYHILSVNKKLYKENFSDMEVDITYSILYLLYYDPLECRKYIDKVEDYFPPIFSDLFNFYRGTSFLLEGKDLDKGTDLLTSITPSLFETKKLNLDDDFKCYSLNNLAIGNFWYIFNMLSKNKVNQTELKELNLKNKLIQYNFLMAICFSEIELCTTDQEKEFYKNLMDTKFCSLKFNPNQFLNTVMDDLPNETLEKIKNKIQDPFNLQMTSKKFNSNFTQEFIRYLLSMENQIDKTFLSYLYKLKSNIFKSKISPFIFSNIGEYLYSNRQYSHAIVYLAVSNLYYKDIQESQNKYAKNMFLIALCNFKQSNDTKEADNMFDKIITFIKNFEPSPEISYIYREYYEYLKEINSLNPNLSVIKENINKIEKIIDNGFGPGFSYRKSKLIIPKEF